MPKSSPMKCPECGIEMNKHAEKLDYSVAANVDAAELGGTVQEVHCCPGCGKTAMRIAS